MADALMKEFWEKSVIDRILVCLEDSPEQNIPKLVNLIDTVLPKDRFTDQRETLRNGVAQKDNHYHILRRAYDLNSKARKTLFLNGIWNSAIKGLEIRKKESEKRGCGIPHAIFIEPNSVFSLHGKDAAPGENPAPLFLNFDTINAIICQGRALGIYSYIYTGGEPLERKQLLLHLCEMHPDCIFFAVTDGYLLDDYFCRDMLHAGNFVPLIRLDGFREAHNAFLGEDSYERVFAAMRLLKKYKLPFGVASACTNSNWEEVSSERYFDNLIENGALFVCFTNNTPATKGMPAELEPEPELTEQAMENLHLYRQRTPILIFDQMNKRNDTQHWLYINAAGEVYGKSNANIKRSTLLDILKERN